MGRLHLLFVAISSKLVRADAPKSIFWRWSRQPAHTEAPDTSDDVNSPDERLTYFRTLDRLPLRVSIFPTESSL